MLKKIENKSLNFFVIISLSYILVLNILNIFPNKLYVLLLLIPTIVLTILFEKKIMLINDTKLLNIISKVLLLSNFIILIIIGKKLMVNFSWDYGEIQRTAINYAKTKTIKYDDIVYFARYPNNRLIVIILMVIYRFLNTVFGPYASNMYLFSSIVVNSFIMGLSYICVYYLCKKQKGDKFAFNVLVFLELMLPIHTYSAIFYSDTLSLIFYPIIIYLFLEYKENNKILYLILIGVIGLIGFDIKATIIFALFAVIIDSIFNEKLKTILKTTLIIATVFIFSNIILNATMDQFLNIGKHEYEQYEFPHTHHIMMMLNETGGYNAEDVIYTKKFPTIEEKKNANIKEIKTRIKERGIFGTAHHLLYTKMVRTWTDSTFSSSDYLGRNPIEKNYLNSFITMDGRYYEGYYIYTYLYYIILLIGMVLSCLYYKNENKLITISKIITLLLIAFLIIWECNSRYVIQIMPLLIIISIFGWTELINKYLKERLLKNE